LTAPKFAFLLQNEHQSKISLAKSCEAKGEAGEHTKIKRCQGAENGLKMSHFVVNYL